jgi:hypothetical protein
MSKILKNIKINNKEKMCMGTGFYDKSIKNLMMKCQRLVVIAVNSIFNKNYNEYSEVIFLDKELPGNEDEETTYMDMLTKIEGDKFHWEFQLEEGSLMSIRVYEYAARETLRNVRAHVEGADEYELYVEMPEQVVVFLSGKNKKDRIKVILRLPDLREVTYTLPCVSAAVNVNQLIEDKLYLFIPYQQVQLNDRMNHIKDRTIKTKKKIAREIKDYQVQVKTALENLKNDGTITPTEFEALMEAFTDIERYLREKDKEVDTEVENMGDENYIPWSERIRNEGRDEVRVEMKKRLADKDEQLANKDEQLAEKDKRLTEMEEENQKLREQLAKLEAAT